MKLLITITLLIYSFTLLSQQSWEALDAGTEFSAGIQSDGSLWTWGNNGNGQLGVGDNNVRETPTQVGSDTDWQSLACGAFHVIALKTDGSLWAWGGNFVNQLGNGNTNDSNEPIQIGSDDDWEFISSVYVHSHAIKSDGTLWGWGWNNYGQIGDNSTDDIEEPKQLGTDSDWLKVTSGAAHALAIKVDGTLWTAGTNLNGQLGINGLSESYEFTQVGTMEWIDISCGFEFSAGIQSDSTFWTWGFNTNGQLGLSNNDQADDPTQVGTADDWAKVTCGSASNFVMNSSGVLYATGFNQLGTLGDGSGTDKNTLEYITDDVFGIWAAKGAVDSGNLFGHHALLLKNASKNVICTTGDNYTFQLGDGTSDQKLEFECETGNLNDASIAENEIDNILVYPNPTADFITVDLDNQSMANFTLYNNSGKKIMDKEITNDERLSLKDFDSGIYFYEIMNNQGYAKKGKVVLSK